MSLKDKKQVISFYEDRTFYYLEKDVSEAVKELKSYFDDGLEDLDFKGSYVLDKIKEEFGEAEE